jgi:dihydrofolate reductase
MSKVRIHNFSISLDGYGAGPNQSLEYGLGVGGEELHNWLVKTASFKRAYGKEGGTEDVDSEFSARGDVNIGAWIMGRNMFGPIRGEWPDESWKGWWGENPSYHCPVFVLTHYPRPSITMQGGTTFHFVTGGIHAALERARKAANGKDIRLGGGVSVIQQFLRERLVDEMHLAVAAVILGSGENIWQGINLLELGYTLSEHVTTPDATHLVFTKSQANLKEE